CIKRQLSSLGFAIQYCPTTPLAPARWPEVMAVSASLGNNPSQIWAFSQHGNIMTRGVSYRIGTTTTLVAGTSFAAPAVTVLLAQLYTFRDICTNPVVNGVARVPV